MAARIFSIVMAAAFFFSSLGLSIYYIIEANRDDTTTDQTQVIDLSEEANVRTLPDFQPTSEAIEELQIIDIVTGSGQEAVAGDRIEVHYTGAYVSSGEIFESSKDGGETVKFDLEGLIEGWQEGIPGMKVGGTRRLLIPSIMAYGPQGSNSIPPNTDLVFDIELKSID